jgi:TolB-like protein/Tfp pilus assembly protein PilF
MGWRARFGCSAPRQSRAEAIFSVATRISPQRSEVAGAAQMSLITELKRRNVFRVGAAYGIVAWLLVEMASVVLPALLLPEWALTLLVFIVVAGFPLALILAWAFELTPDGIKRDQDVEPAESIANQTRRKLDFVIFGLLVVAVIYFAVDKFVLESGPQQAAVVPIQLPASKAVVREKSIAVLPFENLSDDPSNEYFSHGISEELLNVLTRVTSLRVASRTSSFSFKGTNTAIPEIAAQLNVNHILEGSVRKAGNRVRITAQLIDVESDSHLWSDTYDRELDDIFGIQEEIATHIVAELMQKLSAGEAIADSLSPPTTDVAAYEIYLKGRYLLALRGGENLKEAARLFEQAVQIDSSFADAYGALGKAYSLLPGYSGVSDSRPFLEKSEAAIDRSLQLNPDQTEALISKGYNATLYRWEWDEARAVFEHALRVSPNHAGVHNFYGDYFGVIGDFKNAEKFERRAMELDLLSDVHVRDMAVLMVAVGRYDEARAYAQRALELHVSVAGYDELIMTQIYTKDFDAARESILQMEELSEAKPEIITIMWTRYYHAQQDWESARPYYEKFKEAALADRASAALAAEFAVDIEGVEAALELYELAYVRRDPWLARKRHVAPEETSTDPRWLAFWERPGLKELIELRKKYRAEQAGI